MLVPKEVSNAMYAFPADVSEFLPRLEDIPTEFKEYHCESKWRQLFAILFYGDDRSDKIWIRPKPNIDANLAGRHIMCVMRSYQPRHEHKMAGVMYLLDQWFEDWGIEDVQNYAEQNGTSSS